MDARFQLSVLLAFFLVFIVKCPQQVQLTSLFGQGQLGVLDVLDEPIQLGVLTIDISALIDPRQKGRLPILRFLDRITARTHGDETGQVLVFAAQPVEQP